MEDRYLHQGNQAAPMSAQSNNAGMQNGRRGTGKPVPMAASVPNSVNMPMPPMLPKSDNMPLGAAMPAAAILPNANAPAMPEKMPNLPEAGECGYKTGELPPCAPLAAGYVPYQQKNSPKYSNEDALTHGTLFPGLDLPFMNTANKNNPYAGTPLGELMAIDFAVHELTLYLDTHKYDKDAFEMQKTLLALSKDGRKRYEKLYGPIDVAALEGAESFTWLKDPWPWEYAERTGK